MAFSFLRNIFSREKSLLDINSSLKVQVKSAIIDCNSIIEVLGDVRSKEDARTIKDEWVVKLDSSISAIFRSVDDLNASKSRHKAMFDKNPELSFVLDVLRQIDVVIRSIVPLRRSWHLFKTGFDAILKVDKPVFIEVPKSNALERCNELRDVLLSIQQTLDKPFVSDKNVIPVGVYDG